MAQYTNKVRASMNRKSNEVYLNFAQNYLDLENVIQNVPVADLIMTKDFAESLYSILDKILHTASTTPPEEKPRSDDTAE